MEVAVEVDEEVEIEMVEVRLVEVAVEVDEEVEIEMVEVEAVG